MIFFRKTVKLHKDREAKPCKEVTLDEFKVNGADFCVTLENETWQFAVTFDAESEKVKLQIEG